MERSEMLRPTSCDLSPDTNLSKDNNVYEDTEPRHVICTLLWGRAAFLSVFFLFFYPSSSELSAMQKLFVNLRPVRGAGFLLSFFSFFYFFSIVLSRSMSHAACPTTFVFIQCRV